MKSKRIQRIGFLLCAVGIVLMLALWLFFYLSLKPAFFEPLPTKFGFRHGQRNAVTNRKWT